jgi:hypothetical protein
MPGEVSPAKPADHHSRRRTSQRTMEKHTYTLFHSPLQGTVARWVQYPAGSETLTRAAGRPRGGATSWLSRMPTLAQGLMYQSHIYLNFQR